MPSKAEPIDGIHVLRAVAAIMVVAHHARHSVPGSENWPLFGSSGVDIFFVISGYVMALTTQGSITTGQFLIKRFVRIVPLYWLATLYTSRRGPFSLDLLKDALFIPRLNDNWPGWIAPHLQQGWTLNCEMMFYLIFAIAMLVGRWRYFTILAVLGLMPLLSSLPGVAAEFYGNSIVWEFGFGILLFRFLGKFPHWPRSAYLGLVAVGFLLLALLYDQSPRPLTQGLPALLIVWASFKACKGWLKCQPLILLGDASFAIYLFHWASFGAMKPIARVIQNPDLLMVGHILTGIVAGVIIHLAVEKPVTRLVSSWLGLRRVPAALPPEESPDTTQLHRGLPEIAIATGDPQHKDRVDPHVTD